MALLLIQRLLISKHISHWKLTHKVLQLEESIMSSFKMDLNISVIYKTIKIKIFTRGNQNTHKGDNKNIHKGDNENPHKRTNKNTYKKSAKKNKTKNTKL